MQQIVLKNVSKHYRDKTVISNLSLNINLNGITAIMGESGCGKTTLLRLLTNLEKPDSGSINGVPNKVSYMFQEDRLLENFSSLENIKLVSNTKIAEEYLEKVFLSGEQNTLITQLSGGMKRRVALARALAYNSDLLILDEPFKGLDSELKGKIIELIKYESKKRPVIIVVHEIQEANMLDGKVIKFTGTPLRMVT